MKKRILLFTAVAGMALISLTSGQTGAGFESHYNATGSETGLGNVNGCSAAGVPCHSSPPTTLGLPTTGIVVAVELDSAGVSTTHYRHGLTYTVKITGTNTTTHTLPRFGFQVSCIKGTTAQTTPVNAGTFATTGLPTGVQNTPPMAGDFVCDLIEHSTPLAATTLGGATSGTYVVSFSWTAPAAGTGAVSFWAALNAVDFNSAADSNDHWNTTKLIINEWPGFLSVGRLSNNLSLKAYPNPVTNNLTLQIDNAQTGSYSLQVFDLSGKLVTTQQIEINAAMQFTSINTANWIPGMYEVVVEKDGNRQLIPVIKQ